MTQTNKKANNFFLISFLPAILYWYLETKYPVKIALIGGIVLSIAEIIFEKLYIGHVHQLSKFNFGLIVFLGGFSLIEENGVWFKLQPSLSMWAVSCFMIYKLKCGDGFFSEMMKEMRPDAPRPPDFLLKKMERNLTVLFIAYGVLMAILAIWFSTSIWAFFKTAGFFIIFIIFMIVQMIINKKSFIK